MNRIEQDNWAWDRYWRDNRIASCAAAPGRNYQESLLSGWRDFFNALPQSAHVLDVCTGNGAIALVAAEQSRAEDKDFVIEAVDRADISPADFVPEKRELMEEIHFRGTIPVEALPYDDTDFDAVTSQYGIEYADTSAALDEAIRVLKSGGRLRLVLHAREGYTVSAAERDIGECDFLLEESGLFPMARKMFEQVWRAERENADPPPEQIQEVQSVVKSFRQARQAAEARATESANPAIIQSTLSLMADTYAKRQYFPLEILLEKLSEAEKEVRAHRQRLAEMVAAAMNAAEVETLAEDLGERGMSEITTDKEVSGTDGALIGRSVEATKD